MRLSRVVLPEPDGPASTANSPRSKREIDVGERAHLELALAVDLG